MNNWPLKTEQFGFYKNFEEHSLTNVINNAEFKYDNQN